MINKPFSCCIKQCIIVRAESDDPESSVSYTVSVSSSLFICVYTHFVLSWLCLSESGFAGDFFLISSKVVVTFTLQYKAP